MKKPLQLILLFLVLNSISYAQNPEKEFYSEMFKWHITIPQGFINMSAAEYAANQKKGTIAVEKTLEAKIENHSKPIFVLKSDQVHYIEANYQPYNVKTDGNYLTTCKAVDEMLYQTFKQQMQGAQIDSAYTSELIAGLKFNVFKMIITMSNGIELNCYMFSKLFGNKDFSVSMMYVDKQKGEAMLSAMRKSTFGKIDR